MVSLEQAQSRLMRAAKALAPRQTSLENARGHILARALAAPVDLPGASLSAEDGFAVRAEDLAPASPLFPVRLSLTGENTGSGRRRAALGAGRAARIHAYDPLPSGADTVIPADGVREDDDGRIEVIAAPAAGENVISRGSELRRGESVLRRGHELAAHDLGLLATMGLAAAPVYPRPRAGMAFIGEGRVLPGRKPGPGEVPDGNLVMIGAAMDAAGAGANSLGIWPLSQRDVVSALKRHAKVLDLLVMSGGVSPHGANFIAGCLDEAGGRLIFDDVGVTPGRACLAARIGKCLIVALPGDPRGTLAGLHLMVLPVLHRMQGRATSYLSWDEARLGAPVRNAGGVPRLLPGIAAPAVDGGLTVMPEPERHLGSLRGLPGMNAYIILPPATPTLVAGALVRIARLGW